MNKLILTIFGSLTIGIASCQTSINAKLIELAKAYKNFMFRNEPTGEYLKNLQSNVPAELETTTRFIVQTLTTGNAMLTPEYLRLPDSATLKYIFFVRKVNYNINRESPVDNNQFVDSLKLATISKNECVDNYYAILFNAVGNKNQPFNLSKMDFRPKEYNLSNDTEEGIFFLRCMSLCGMEIWGYMNVVKPPNTDKAFSLIKKYPKINGLKYYQYTDLNFPDFEMQIEEGKPKESYKGYYINKYYDLLLSHFYCLQKDNAKEKDINDLLLGSILEERNLYKYSKKRDVLENIFKEQKTN